MSAWWKEVLGFVGIYVMKVAELCMLFFECLKGGHLLSFITKAEFYAVNIKLCWGKVVSSKFATKTA